MTWAKTIVSLAAAVWVAVVSNALADSRDDRVHASLVVEGCGSASASYEELTTPLEVEWFSSFGQRVDIVPFDDAAVTFIVQCASSGRTRLTVREEGHGLSQVYRIDALASETVARSIALLLVDLYEDSQSFRSLQARAESARSPALGLSAPTVGPSEPPVRSVDGSSGRSSGTAGDSTALPAVELVAGFAGQVALDDAAFQPGLRAGVGLNWGAWGVRMLLDAVTYRAEDDLGEITVVGAGLGLSLVREVVRGDFALAVFGEVRPAVVFASAQASRSSVSARNDEAAVFDVGLGAYVEWAMTSDFSIRIESGLTYSPVGYEARAMTRRIAGWSGVRFPTRFDLVWML